MVVAPIPLRIVLSENRFITDISTPDAPLQIPPFTFGDVLPIKLEGYQRSLSDASQFSSVDLHSLNVSLFIGSPNQRPSIGLWTIDFGSGVLPALHAQAKFYEVQNVVGVAYIVEGTPGDFIITAIANGVKADPTVAYEGSLDVEATLTVINAGTSSTPASWRVELIESAPAVCEDWTAGSVTPTSTITNPVSKIFWVTLDPDARGGFFTLTCGGAPTGPLSLFISPTDLQYALRFTGTGGNGAQVQRHPNGGFLITLYSGSTTLTLSDTLLVIPANITGQMDLAGDGVRALLDGAKFVGLSIVARISDGGGNLVSEAIAPIILQMPVVRA